MVFFYLNIILFYFNYQLVCFIIKNDNLILRLNYHF